MSAAFRLLVTGSREYADLTTIRQALTEAQGDRAPAQMLLVHGRCDPYQPGTGRRIPWAKAKAMRRVEQSFLLGADWLAEWVAIELGWPEPERHPATWDAPCRPTCRAGHRRLRSDGTMFCPAAGDYRNEEMVNLGAGECCAFILPCTDRGCWRPGQHGTHGSTNCADLARLAGIPARRFTTPR